MDYEQPTNIQPPVRMSRYDVLPSHEAAFYDKIANAGRANILSDETYQRAKMGQTIEEMDEMDYMAQIDQGIAEKVNQLSTQRDSIKDDSSGMDAAGQNYLNQANQQTPLPEMQQQQVNPWMALASLGASLIDPRNAAQYLMAPIQGAELASRKKYADEMQHYQAVQQQRKEHLAVAELAYRMEQAKFERQARTNESLRSDLTQEIRDLRSQSNKNNLALFKSQQDMIAKAQEAKDKKELEYIKGLMRKMSPAMREQFASQFSDNANLIKAAGELTIEEQKGVAQIGKIDAETRYLWARQNELETLLPGKAEKLQKEIEGLSARTSLTKANKELVDKKVSNYDAEYKLRAANVYSQIAKRGMDAINGAGKGDTKTENQTISDLKNLISIAEAQLKDLKPDGFFDVDTKMRQEEIKADIAKAQKGIQDILNARQASEPAKEIPPGPIGPTTKGPNPKIRGKKGFKPIEIKLPDGARLIEK